MSLHTALVKIEEQKILSRMTNFTNKENIKPRWNYRSQSG